MDSYDAVKPDFSQSGKAPVAILQKRYAYPAIKDKLHRSLWHFKQVVT